jgi:hypothetical protein
MRRNRVIYTLLSIGLIGGFLGHGMFAATLTNDKFPTLLTGTFDNLFGVTMSQGTAEAWVQAIGFFDLAVVAVLVAMLVGNIQAKGALYEFAYSKFALVLLAWGALWGFLTAGSRVTAAGELYPELWDVVERAPNFLLPAAMVYLVYQHRLDHSVEASSASELKVPTTH